MSTRAPTVDAYVHVWPRHDPRHPVPRSFQEVTAADATVESLVEHMHDTGVHQAVLVQVGFLAHDNAYLVECLRRFPGRLVAVGFIDDPFAAEAAERLMHHRQSDGLRGVMISVTQPAVAERMVAGAADPLLERARALDMPVLVQNRMPCHYALASIAARFPEVKLVVCHLGHPEVAEAPDHPSSATLFGLAAHPNVYVLVSNHPFLSRAGFPWADLHPYQRRLLDVFGPQRLLWGSNWAVHPALGTYAERVAAVGERLTVASAEERAWLLGKTAQTLWRFGEAR